MEDLLSRQLWSGLFNSGEWATILLFLGMGLVYFLAPAAGYTLANRFRIALGMWVLVGKFGLALIRLSLWTTLIVDRSSPKGFGNTFPSPLDTGLMYLPILESSALILAMIMFILGLQGLKRRVEHPAAQRFESES